MTKRKRSLDVQPVPRVTRVNHEGGKDLLEMIKQAELRGPIPLFRDDADARVELIRKTHDLKPTFPLKGKFYEIWVEKVRFGQHATRKGARTTTRVRKFLLRAGKLATALSQLLHKTSNDELEAILASSGERGLTFLPPLQEHLVHLAATAFESQRRMRTGAGRRPDTLLDSLIFNLRDVFHAGSDGDHTVCSRNVEGEFTGEFYFFVRDSLPLFGIEKSDTAIGRRIERILSKSRKRPKSNTGIRKVRNKSGV